MPHYIIRGIPSLFSSKRFFFSKISGYFAFFTKQTTNLPKPIAIQIEPTSKCNLSCEMCSVKKDKSNCPPLTKPQFRKLVENCQPIDSVNLSGLGEPLLNPNFEDYTKNLSNLGATVFTISNIQLLNKDRIKKIFDSGLKILCISLESIHPKEYEKIRVGAKFSILTKNLKLISKQATKHPKVIVNLNVLLGLHNIADYDFMKTIVNFSTEFSINSVNFFVIDDVITTNTLTYIDKNKAELSQVFLKITNYSKSKNINITLPNLNHSFGTCTSPWLFPFISISGDVFPCCAFPHFALEAGETRKEMIKKYSFGNIYQQNLKDVWNSPRAIALRQEFVDKKYNKYCDVCAKLHGLK
jgi:MoaA/NifB/PqqE/SkfB family radical SAM enzyme